MSRRTRDLIALASVSCLVACTQHRLVAPEPAPQVTDKGTWIEARGLALDIVFLVDDSFSMNDKQENLVRNFSRFMRVLEDAVPDGETLDAHIAVVSSDLGVANSTGVDHCSTPGGANGAFQSAPRGACAGPRGSFILTNAGGKNFDGDIADVFSCIARLGTDGCGFEHQLGALRRALGGDPAAAMPPQNAGFLRPNARLGLILITDEDDCSAPAGSDLFTPDPAAEAAYGPRDSYRCNEFGHLCGGAPPPRAVVSGLTCVPNETATSRLVHVRDFVDFFSGLKADPDMLRVAAIAGPPAPYGTHSVETRTGIETRISPSCTGPSGTGAGDAAPAVRLESFVDAFGDRGLFETICAADFGPAMEHIAQSLVTPAAPCIDGRLYDRAPAQPGLQADCNVTERRPSATDDAPPIDAVVPACDDVSGTTPCWRLSPDARCVGKAAGLAITVDHGTTPAVPGTRAGWSCRVCLPGVAGAGCAP
jgi:hypothetical protein